MDLEKDPPVSLASKFSALGSEPRLRILVELSQGELHVSELARRVGMSRQLLYLHLAKLEEAGFIIGVADLAPDGKALKLYSLKEFDLHINMAVILRDFS